MKKVLLIYLLSFSQLVMGQTYVDVGVGSGQSSHFISDGTVFQLSIEHASEYDLRKRITVNVLHASKVEVDVKYKRYGYSFLERTFSTPIEFLQDEQYKKHFRAWRQVNPDLYRESFISLDVQLGMLVYKLRRSYFSLYIGPTLTRYEAVYPYFVFIDRVIEDLSDEKMETYFFAFLSYYDVGWATSLEYFYELGKLSLGMELKGNKYGFSQNGYTQALVKLRARL